MEDRYARLCPIAARQHGVVTIDDVRGAAVTRSQLNRLCDTGRLVRLAPRAFLLGGAPEDWHARVMAECLSAGPHVLASHRTAAALWGLNGFDQSRILHLSAAAPFRPRPRPDVKIHPSVDFQLATTTKRQLIPVTGIGRTLLDLCASEPNRAVALRAIDSARKQKLISWAELRHVLDTHARHGRRGVTTLRDLLDLRVGGDSESPLEDLVYELLVAASLPAPVRQYRVTTRRGLFRIDLAYPPPLRIALECKGKGDHLTDAAFEADPVRENALQIRQWLLLTFTKARYDTDPDGIVAEVAAALRWRGAA